MKAIRFVWIPAQVTILPGFSYWWRLLTAANVNFFMAITIAAGILRNAAPWLIPRIKRIGLQLPVKLVLFHPSFKTMPAPTWLWRPISKRPCLESAFVSKPGVHVPTGSCAIPMSGVGYVTCPRTLRNIRVLSKTCARLRQGTFQLCLLV